MFQSTRSAMRNYLRGRYGANLENMKQNQYVEQFSYGHRETLLEYANLPKNLLFKAIIPHGKIAPHSLDPISPVFDLIDGSEILQLLWRDDSIEEALRVGVKNVNSIGAPFLYTLANLGQPIEKTRQNLDSLSQSFNWRLDRQEDFLLNEKRITYFPMHSWEGDVHVHNVPKDSILRKIDPSRVVVCLGFLDFCDPKVRKVYEECGWKLTCAGVRDSIIVGSPAGGREKFLNELARIFFNTDLVLANEFTTGLFYAAAAGKKIAILPTSQAHDLEYSSWNSKESFRNLLWMQRNTYPWLWGEEMNPQQIKVDLETALGLNSFKSPDFFINDVEKTAVTGYGQNSL